MQVNECDASAGEKRCLWTTGSRQRRFLHTCVAGLAPCLPSFALQNSQDWCQPRFLRLVECGQGIFRNKFVHAVLRQGIWREKFIRAVLRQGILRNKFVRALLRQGIWREKFVRAVLRQGILRGNSSAQFVGKEFCATNSAAEFVCKEFCAQKFVRALLRQNIFHIFSFPHLTIFSKKYITISSLQRRCEQFSFSRELSTSPFCFVRASRQVA